MRMISRDAPVLDPAAASKTLVSRNNLTGCLYWFFPQAFHVLFVFLDPTGDFLGGE